MHAHNKNKRFMRYAGEEKLVNTQKKNGKATTDKKKETNAQGTTLFTKSCCIFCLKVINKCSCGWYFGSSNARQLETLYLRNEKPPVTEK